MESKTLRCDAFGHIIEREEKPVICDAHILKQYGVEVDKDTGDTKIVITGEVDLTELIESYKDQCGMEMALKMLKTGQADPSAFADNGKAGADCTILPTDLNSANAQIGATAEGRQLAEQLGITSGMTAEEITAKVAAAIQASLDKGSEAAKEE